MKTGRSWREGNGHAAIPRRKSWCGCSGLTRLSGGLRETVGEKRLPDLSGDCTCQSVVAVFVGECILRIGNGRGARTAGSDDWDLRHPD